MPTKLLPKDTKGNTPSDTPTDVISNFWQTLMKLDSLSNSRKGKTSIKNFQVSSPTEHTDTTEIFTYSPVGELMTLFNHQVIQGSVSLIDKLLRVLSVISGAIPKQGLHTTKPPEEDNAAAKTDATTSGSGDGTATVVGGATIGDSEAGPSAQASVEDTDSAPQSFSSKCFSESVVSISLLDSAVQLLTSGKCSEESLDDATSLLINLSRCSAFTREAILLVLVKGVHKIGGVLCEQIATLLNELILNVTVVTQRQSSNDDSSEPMATGTAPSLGTVEGVVLPTVQGAEHNIDHAHDLHLPCMGPLICKGSQQSFFLRLLKVVCQLRESAILSQGRGLGVTPTERSQEETRQETTATSSTATEGEGEGPSSQDPPSNQPNADTAIASILSQDANAAVAKEIKPHLPSLSLQLELEELWSTLSECLDALATTYDPHAVLVLQPTVEAFFLVHADQVEDTKKTGSSDKRSSRQGGRRHPSLHTISDTESIPGSPRDISGALSCPS